MKQTDETSVWSNGKFTFTLFPDVYATFVFELNKNHQDILRAMVLAQVKLDDGSALDFLNTFLGTQISKHTPMEIGFASLLDALRMRSINALSSKAIEKTAAQFKNHSMFPHRSDPSKPIFPDEPDQ